MDGLEWDARRRLGDDVDLTDLEGNFFGALCNQFKIDHLVFEAIEDQDDGYRSMLECVTVNEPSAAFDFFQTPLDHVKILCDDFYEVISTADGHVWLRFGTDYTDSYYPMFVFEYTPRKEAVR